MSTHHLLGPALVSVVGVDRQVGRGEGGGAECPLGSKLFAPTTSLPL